jgi:hypothetical protein
MALDEAVGDPARITLASLHGQGHPRTASRRIEHAVVQ